MAGAEPWTRRRLLVAGAAAGALGGRAWAEAGLVVRNATVVLPDGRRLADHGLRAEGGSIAEIGPSSSFPAEGAVDAGGAWLVPGFTDAGCVAGLYEIDLERETRDDDESRSAVNTDIRARDGYNPRSALIPTLRANGLLSLLVHPAPAGLISGQAALVRTTGDTIEAALVRAPAALCLNLGRAAIQEGREGAPGTRMGVAARFREILDAVKLPEDQEPQKGEKRRKKSDSNQEHAKVEPDERVSAAERTLRELRRGRIPALLRAERADDLLFGMDLARTYGLKPILLGGAEAGLVAREIAEAGVPLFLGPLTAQPDSFEQLAARYDNAAVLHRAGVRLAFRTGAAHSARLLPQQAAVAVAHGLPWEAAVHGLSAAAWEILGIPGMGRLEVGAEATFFLADGDPLQPRHAVRRAWIAGREVSLQTRQTRLYEAFRTLR